MVVRRRLDRSVRERKAVQRMLGDASAAVTLDVYADLFEDDLAAVANALDHRAMQTNVAEMLPKRL